MPLKLLLPALTLMVALAPLSVAVAQSSSARLLERDAPRVATLWPARDGARFLGATHSELAVEAGPSLGQHFGVTLLPAILASTTGVVLAWGLGSISNALLGVAVPALLAHLLVGPVLTTLVAWLVGNDGGERYGFWGPAAASFVLHAAMFAVASLLFVVPWTNPVALLVYSAVDGLLMSAGSVGVMRLFPRKVATAELPSFVPGVSATRVVGLSRVEF
jgi:hypothetical protein